MGITSFNAQHQRVALGQLGSSQARAEACANGKKVNQLPDASWATASKVALAMFSAVAAVGQPE